MIPREELGRKIGDFVIGPCHKSFNRLGQLWLHICSVHKILSSDVLRKMMISNRQKKDSECSEDSKGVWSEIDTSTIVCPFIECDRQEFSSWTKWRSHVKRHSDPHKCDYCEETFLEYPQKIEHEKQMHADLRILRKMETRKRKNEPETGPEAEKEIIYKCHLCSKIYMSRSGMVNHVRFDHSEDPNSFQCKLCNRNFKTKQNLSRHLSMIHDSHRENHRLKPPSEDYSGYIFREESENYIDSLKVKTEGEDNSSIVSTNPGESPMGEKYRSIYRGGISIPLEISKSIVEEVEEDARNLYFTLNKRPRRILNEGK